ncbi:NAD(P)H-binding protein [Motilimonas cestriensis]|uniref:NAD(P)H-binding protein n=1 Tax=Motilimonas cestriensis TaxID=2742685 RepID=A0ABS8WE12_9GAMM|nr:NAD(P)H-binding protein [Motilimonas cestriensis]MCE2596552.1 NAD(P)H-binding protein [Motilimonas cestriensis]
MIKAKVAIFGCGWLGEPLALALQQSGWPVSVCRRDEAQVARLKQLGLDAYAINVANDDVTGNVAAWSDQAETVIIMLPPRSKSQQPERYEQQIAQLIQALQKQQVRQVLFISSTGVYAEGNYLLTEQSPLKQNSALVTAEQAMQAAFSSIILRFSGLVNKDRTPARFLAGKHLSGGLTPTNLIHQDDCIDVICQLLTKPWQADVYNLSTENGPSRAHFYVRATQHSGLTPPTFTDDNSFALRSVSSQKILHFLDYQFKHPDILAWLTNET